MRPKLSVIILSYNTKQITKNCLNSIRKETDVKKLPLEIIVVDNNSKDGSQEMLEKFKKQHEGKNLKITLLLEKENLGFSKANNKAAKLAMADTLLFLNSDIIVLDRGIEKLYSFFEKKQRKYQFAGGKLLNKDLSPQPSCGPYYTLPIIFATLFLRGNYWGLTRYSPEKTKEVDWVSGACLMTKKDIFLDLGGFDENLFMYMEEVELLYRAKKTGYKTVFYPEARFIHLESASSKKRTYPIIQVYKGFAYLYQKHHGKLENLILKFLLKLKANIAILIGKITNNNYLIKTYEQAKKMV